MRRILPALLRSGLAAGLAASTALSAAGVVGAATLTLTTPYPSIVADAGSSPTFTLTLGAPNGTTVKVSVPKAPDGWTTTLRGGGSIVEAIFVLKSPATVDLEVKVPLTATPGAYALEVKATDDSGGAVTLPLSIRVPDTTGGGVTLTAQFPALKGAASASYPFSLTLANDSSQKATFTLQGSGPPGWTVDARWSSSSQAVTIDVEAGATTQVNVNVSPPTGAPAATYPITVQATGGPAVASVDLSVEITGSYGLTLSTPDGRLNTQVNAGNASTMTLVVQNTGSAELDGVALSGTPPQGWTVTFDPAIIPVIAAGDSTNVTATITPTGDAIAGDYALTFSAKNDQANASVDIRSTVATSAIWGVVGLVAIGLVFVGLFYVFRRYGRR
ncbi:MAG: NEW3 domain-containing protein [Candidatus Limnocylindrales bacterium]